VTARLQEVLGEITALEPFPVAAVRVLELVLNDASSEEIVAVLAQDPGLTSRVLGLANSAKYAPRTPIETLADATWRLGTRTVASLSVTMGVASYFSGYGRSTQRSNATLWEECLHVAFFARRLAVRAGGIHGELAYTVGLLQNLGHVVLDRFLEEERDAIKSRTEGGFEMLAAERDVLGIDHAQCGARMAERWGLPDVLVRAIRWHHAPGSAGDLAALCSVVNLAEGLAFRQLTDHGISLLDAADPEAMRGAAFAEGELDELERRVGGDLMDTALALG
jgi:HD-like signal output (HDOD) protein